jgi:catechol 2,3-dioxygenase-like lactoylglutathione lyase family enzyme
VSISHVQLFSIPVTDQDRARKFPVGTLGLELVADTDGIVLQETAVQP